MRVDQKRARGQLLGAMPGQMNFADRRQRKCGKIGARVKAMVRGRNEHIVNVKQKPAACAACEFCQEIGLGPSGLRECDIGRRIFQQHPAAKRVLHLLDMIADTVAKVSEV